MKKWIATTFLRCTLGPPLLCFIFLHLLYSLMFGSSFLRFCFIRPNVVEPQLMNIFVTVPIISRDWLTGSPFLLPGENVITSPWIKCSPLVQSSEASKLESHRQSCLEPTYVDQEYFSEKMGGMRAEVLSFGKDTSPKSISRMAITFWEHR